MERQEEDVPTYEPFCRARLCRPVGVSAKGNKLALLAVPRTKTAGCAILTCLREKEMRLRTAAPEAYTNAATAAGVNAKIELSGDRSLARGCTDVQPVSRG